MRVSGRGDFAAGGRGFIAEALFNLGKEFRRFGALRSTIDLAYASPLHRSGPIKIRESARRGPNPN